MKKFLIRFFVAGVLGGGLYLWSWWHYEYTYSEGDRAGLLQKFSHRGNLFKTYEGELVLSTVVTNGTTTLSSERFFFSVADPKIAASLNQFQGKPVVVHYSEKKATLPWRGETTYIVDSVRAE